MTRANPASEKRFSVREALATQGKIGLLIDDAKDGPARVARALYGCEVLPEWWHVERFFEASGPVLRELEAQLRLDVEKGGARDFRGIVIIDRYLRFERGGRPIPWDGPLAELAPKEAELCREIQKLVISLQKLNSEVRGLFLELETSFPHGYWPYDLRNVAGDQKPLPWKSRSIDLIFRLRKKITPADRDLLNFGPTQHLIRRHGSVGDGSPAPTRETRRPPSRLKDQEAWIAEVWWDTLRALAKALDEQKPDCPVVLMTGAGASINESSFGPGMPPTGKLLAKACEKVIAWNPRLWPPGNQGPRPPDEQQPPVVRIVDKCYAGDRIEARDWPLEELFSLRKNDEENDLFSEFRNAFRSVLHDYDKGFAFHHWLLAQLPWTRILTTNFDGFHERAAASAAAAPANAAATPDLDRDQRNAILRLGSRLPNASTGTEQERNEERTKRRLFKPYGSLLLPDALGLGKEDLESCEKHLRAEFHSLFKDADSGWLVVIGHAMRDQYIQRLLNQVAGDETAAQTSFLRRFRFVWIDPDAFRRSVTPEPKENPRTWDLWMKRLRENGNAGPVPAKAHAFVYDLWRVCSGEAIKYPGIRQLALNRPVAG